MLSVHSPDVGVRKGPDRADSGRYSGCAGQPGFVIRSAMAGWMMDITGRVAVQVRSMVAPCGPRSWMSPDAASIQHNTSSLRSPMASLP